MDTRIRKFAAVVFVVVSLVVCAAQTGSVQGQSPVVANSAVNGRIAFASYRGGSHGIYVMNADGTGVTRLTSGFGDLGPSWSPDGSKIAFSSWRDGGGDEIYVMNADGTGQTRLTYGLEKYAWAPSWSPDGSKIAFASTGLDGGWIYVMNADGSGATRLINWGAGVFDFGPSWSPDGSKIVFPSSDGGPGGYEIYVVNIDGSGVTNLTNNPALLDYYPSWSPDGGKIAFASDRNGNDEIYIMNTDGSGVTNLTNNSAWDMDPSWSPDGSKIAFFSYRDGNSEIYTMNADGTEQTNQTNNPASDWFPSWGPGEVVIPTPTPAPTTQPTVQPTPTLTPFPTLTPQPTVQPTVTATPQPTSTPSAGDIHLNVPLLRQNEGAWASDIYNLYGSDRIADTIAKWGCATTSAAMVLSYYSGVQVDPKDLDDWLAANSGYTPKHGVIWTRIPWFAWERLGLTLAQPVYAATTLSRLDSALAFENENPPIVNVCWKDCSDTNEARWHWVVVIGKSGSEYLINDPSGWLNRQTLGQYPVWGNMVTYASASGPTAPSLWLYLCSPAEMLVTDSLGRRTGIDPTTGEEFSEIPGASYGDEYLSPADDSGGGTMHTKVLVLPEGGIYTVEVIGTGDGSYTLLAISSGDGGQPLSQSVTRSVVPGQVDSYVLDYSPTDGDMELFQNTYLPLVSR